MSERLTTYDRQLIAKRASEAAWEATFNSLANDERLLALDVYYTRIDRDALKIAETLPPGWLVRADCLTVNAGGRCLYLYFGAELKLPVTEDMQRRIDLTGGDLISRITKWSDAKEKAEEGRRKAELATRAMLNDVTTYKRLREVWPEGEPFYRDRTKKAPPVPAVRVEEVNALLGLK